MTPFILVEVDEDANVKVEAFGFKGKACQLATKPFVDLMNQPVEQAKPEMNLLDTAQKNQLKNKVK